MRLGIISDIHENLEMLERALKLADFHKCDEMVCLGDIVGFDKRFYRHEPKRSASSCVRMVRRNCRWVVPGNHDIFAAGRFPQYTNGFDYPSDWFTMDPAVRKKISRGKVWCYGEDLPNDLTEDDIMYLRELPEFIATSDPHAACLFSHYIYPDLTGSTTRYVEKNHQLKGLWEFMNKQEVRYSFSGHSHTVFAGFAFKKDLSRLGSYLKAIHSIHSSMFRLGSETVMVLLPALAGEKGKTGFTVFDTNDLTLNIVLIN